MKTSLLLASVVVVLPTAAFSADLNGSDRFSEAHFPTSPSSTSWWELWGAISLGFEYYEDNFGYEEAAVNTSGEIVFEAPSGFNFKARFGGAAFDQDYVSGFANLDLFYATSGFAVGAYGGSLLTTNDFDSAWIGVQAAMLFSQADVGVYVQVDGFRAGRPIYVASAWLKGYLTPNTVVGVNYEHDWNQDVRANFLTVHTEHRFAGTNFGAYTQVERSWQRGDFKSWDVFGGLRVYFDRDNATLQDYQHAANPFWWSCCW